MEAMMIETYSDCLTVARAELSAAHRLLSAEIRAYPTPISGCDAQFNHLLAERQRISGALAQLEASVFVPTLRTPMPSSGVESR
ncbi:MAG: hypothetical protein AAFU63_11990 [Pseudomonadota bacterium]